jgi:hypothetical protein
MPTPVTTRIIDLEKIYPPSSDGIVATWEYKPESSIALKQTRIVSLPCSGKQISLALDEFRRAKFHVYEALWQYPYLAKAVKEDPFLLGVMLVHQFLAGDARRKYNPATRLAEHDMRVANNLVASYNIVCGRHPSRSTTAGTILHDSLEDHNASTDLIGHLFGKQTIDFVEGLTLPKHILALEDPDKRARLKQAFKVSSIENLSFDQCSAKFADTIDVPLSYIRQKALGLIEFADVDNAVFTPGRATLLPVKKVRKDMKNRYIIYRELLERVERVARDLTANPDGYDAFPFIKFFCAQAAKTGLLFRRLTGIDLPPDWERESDALPPSVQTEIERMAKNSPFFREPFILSHN